MPDPMTFIGVVAGAAIVSGITWTAANWNERTRRLRAYTARDDAKDLAQAEHQLRVKSDAKVRELEERLKAEVDANMRLVRRMNQIREEMEQTQGRAA